MKRLHLFGLALMAIFAVSATASAVASAELAILPTPSAGSPVKFELKSVGSTTLESTSGKKIACSTASGPGQATSERLGTVKLTFTGCKNTATLAKCTGLDDINSGEILFEAEWHLRHLLPASAGVAIVILVPHVHWSCAGILFLVEGCVASMDLLTKSGGESIVEKLLTSGFGSFLQANGQQKPLEIDNDKSTADESCMLIFMEESRENEEAGQLGEGTIEKFEQGGKAVTILVHLK